jgi:undecaprenyl diphosphate synthase
MKTLVHIAVIPDGNRRWAKEQGLPTFEGHRCGFDQASQLIKKARDLGIRIFTLWAFSTENWQRSTEEVNYLMNLYEIMIDKNLAEALKNNTRIIHIGRKDRLNENLKKKIINAEEKTKNLNQYFLVIALDYGGRDEVIRAMKKVQSSNVKVQNLNEKIFEQFLDTKDLPQPNPDLIIRTSGEQRMSGLMIWQAAYAEYIFSNKYFPDFTPDDLEKCLEEFNHRQRRFGR